MTLKPAMAVLIAFASAVATATIAALLAFQAAQRLQFWFAELFATVIAAVVWMLVGLKIAPRHPAVGPVLFGTGVAAAWFVTRGVVHSTSPYHGLVPIEAGVLAAWLAWSATEHRTGPRWLRIVLSVTAFLLILAFALGTPTLGVMREMYDADGNSKSIHTGFIGGSTYIWSPSDLTYTDPVLIELSPGSGPGEYRVLPVSDPARIASLCTQIHASTDSQVATELANGFIPAFVTRLPYRFADCEAGQFWRLDPSR